MTLWLDGAYLDPADASVNVADRGFLLGDGLFETMRLEAGVLRRWARHEKRLTAGLDALGIAADLPSDIPALAADLANRNGLDRAVIRLTITRGSGGRGLDGASGTKPCVLMTAGALPERSAPALVLVNAPRRAPLTLAAPGFMVPRRPSSIFSIAGWSMTAKLWVLALDQEARSTTRTEESRRSRAASSPVMSWTCGTEMSAMSRRFSTAAPISADPRVGPAGVRRAAVEAASSQLMRAWAWADVSRAEDSIGPIRSQGPDIPP